MYLLSEMNIFPAMLLLSLWGLTGWLIVSAVFEKQIAPNERGLIGIGLGLVVCTFLANWFARFLPSGSAFWGAGLIGVMLGFLVLLPKFLGKTELPKKNLIKSVLSTLFPIDSIQLQTWFFFILFSIIFTLIGRGFGFFDDHQNLAPVSIMATGDIPPHFSYNPSLGFGYHYFLLLVAAQFVKLSNAGPWTALDLARGISLALTLTYGSYLSFRITRNKTAQFFTVIFMAFAGGARWLFFFLPSSLQKQLSSSITLIGSGAVTGPNLITALYKNWKIEGLGPIPFPFVFGSGLDSSMSMLHNGWGTSSIMIVLL
ncbi:MAG: hypothetical protein WCP19_01100, partial [Chloroflexota bacterium]